MRDFFDNAARKDIPVDRMTKEGIPVDRISNVAAIIVDGLTKMAPKL